MQKDIEIKGVWLEIDYDYEPEQKEDLETQGYKEQCIIISVYVNGIDIIELVKDTYIFDLIEEKLIND